MSLNPPLRHWTGQRVWLVGASSGIGQALAQELYQRGARVILSARNQKTLNQFVSQHPGSQALALDVTNNEKVQEVAHEILKEGPLDLLCYCAGYYEPMHADQMDLDTMLLHQQINTVGTLQVLAAITPALLTSKRGHISLISSVAGYRGLPKSLAYGPTKAALINLAETLYLDLHPMGIGVSLINPGFVETPMTAQNDFPMPGLISAKKAAQFILEGWTRGEFEIHFPKRFTCLMKLLRVLPYRLYFPLVKRVTGV